MIYVKNLFDQPINGELKLYESIPSSYKNSNW